MAIVDLIFLLLLVATLIFFWFHFRKAFDFLIFEKYRRRNIKIRSTRLIHQNCVTPDHALNEDSYVDDSRILQSDWERSSKEDS